MTIASQFNDKQRIVLVKIETTYGSDPTPTVAANAIEVKGLSIQYPFDVLERDLQHEDMSQDAPVTGKRMAEISFEMELKGGGTRGTASKISPLLKACRMTEDAVAATKVAYVPGAVNYSCTIYVYDVNVTASANYLLHKFLGCVGNAEISMKAGQIPTIKFSFKALYTKPSDVADPGTPVYESTLPPVVKSASMTWGTEAGLIIEDIQVMLNNVIAERPSINSATSIAGYTVTGRKPTGNINPEKTLIAEYDFFDDLEDKNAKALQTTAGAVSGNIIMISATNVTVDKINIANRNGIGTLDLPVHFNRVAGNDEFSLVFT
jgi:hypothetical protein